MAFLLKVALRPFLIKSAKHPKKYRESRLFLTKNTRFAPLESMGRDLSQTSVTLFKEFAFLAALPEL
jgi:hypothetical protein